MYKKIVLFIFIIVLSSQKVIAKSLADYEHKEPIAINDIQFVDENNNINSLNDYSGKVVLINFWATWCVPCVQEMPSLSKLHDNISGLNAEVIPISVDFKGIDAVKKFYTDTNIKNLYIYMDNNGESFQALKLLALPTTIIVNKDGFEVARVYGEFDWSTKDVKNYFIKLSSD